MLRSTYAIVSRTAIDHNIATARALLPAGVQVLAVVKANAYGHGIVPIGRHLDRNDDVSMLGVALCEEGIALRRAGVKKPILILGTTDNRHWKAVVRYDLTPTVYTPEHIFALSRAAARQERTACAHLKIDSGMHRIGVASDAALMRVIDAFDACRNVKLDGVFTHFAKSESDPAFTERQARRFDACLARIRERGYSPLAHAANSGAILSGDRYAYDMVRLGIAMYGYRPDGEPSSTLRPALSFVTHIAHLKTLEAGAGISYGQRYVTDRKTVVATLPVGYGDGYKRCLSGKSHVLIGGVRCPQIGTICMDQMMVDVSAVDNVRVGDEAVLIGAQGTEAVTADALAALSDTISYEILLSISDRVPRVFR